MRYFIGGVLGWFAVLVWAAFAPGCALFERDDMLTEGAIVSLTEGAAISLQFSELVHGYCANDLAARESLLYDIHQNINRFSAPHVVSVSVVCG